MPELRSAIALSVAADRLADQLEKVRDALAEAKREAHRSGATRAWHAITRAEEALRGLQGASVLPSTSTPTDAINDPK